MNCKNKTRITQLFIECEHESNKFLCLDTFGQTDEAQETSNADLTSIGTQYTKLYQEFKELQSMCNGLKEEQDTIKNMMKNMNSGIHNFIFI